jgi:hypothetical protein
VKLPRGQVAARRVIQECSKSEVRGCGGVERVEYSSELGRQHHVGCLRLVALQGGICQPTLTAQHEIETLSPHRSLIGLIESGKHCQKEMIAGALSPSSFSLNHLSTIGNSPQSEFLFQSSRRSDNIPFHPIRLVLITRPCQVSRFQTPFFSFHTVISFYPLFSSSFLLWRTKDKSLLSETTVVL